MAVTTKTGNENKRAQTSTNHQQTTTNHQKMNTNYQQTTANYQQTTPNSHSCTSNQKADVSFLLPECGNYKDHPEFRQSVRGNCLLLSQNLCGASKIGSVCFGRLSSQHSNRQQGKSTFLLIFQVITRIYSFYKVVQIPRSLSS